jgi:hypothetical protein
MSIKERAIMKRLQFVFLLAVFVLSAQIEAEARVGFWDSGFTQGRVRSDYPSLHTGWWWDPLIIDSVCAYPPSGYLDG